MYTVIYLYSYKYKFIFLQKANKMLIPLLYYLIRRTIMSISNSVMCTVHCPQ